MVMKTWVLWGIPTFNDTTKIGITEGAFPACRREQKRRASDGTWIDLAIYSKGTPVCIDTFEDTIFLSAGQ